MSHCRSGGITVAFKFVQKKKRLDSSFSNGDNWMIINYYRVNRRKSVFSNNRNASLIVSKFTRPALNRLYCFIRATWTSVLWITIRSAHVQQNSTLHYATPAIFARVTFPTVHLLVHRRMSTSSVGKRIMITTHFLVCVLSVQNVNSPRISSSYSWTVWKIRAHKAAQSSMSVSSNLDSAWNWWLTISSSLDLLV